MIHLMSFSNYDEVLLCCWIFKDCADTDRVEALTTEERGGCAQVSVVKLNVVGPLFPSSQTPGSPPALVVQDGSPLVVFSDLYTQYTTSRAN